VLFIEFVSTHVLLAFIVRHVTRILAGGAPNGETCCPFPRLCFLPLTGTGGILGERAFRVFV